MEESKIKKIGILTSGGDSPGMNSVIAAVYKTFRGINSEKVIDKNNANDQRPLELLLIRNGYKGLLENDIQTINDNWAQLIDLGTEMGGTIIGAARYKPFEDEEVRRKAVKILQEHDIQGIIAIGGDGTYIGLQKLSEQAGIQCVGIPGTIDNDVNTTEFTIGFDTALNTVVASIDKIRQTSNSHARIAIVEVMGRNCGDLAIHGAAATNAEILSTPELKIEENELVRIVKDLYHKQQRRSIVIVVTENLYDVKKIAIRIESETKCETRATVLGQIQRGGTPTAFDRYLATMMGIFAAEQFFKSTKFSVYIGLQGNKLVAKEIQDVLNAPIYKQNKINTINKILRLSGIIATKK